MYSGYVDLRQSPQKSPLVAKVLGHSQLKTTQRYAHLSQEMLLEAVDAAAEATGTDWGQAQME
jgi:integrase